MCGLYKGLSDAEDTGTLIPTSEYQGNLLHKLNPWSGHLFSYEYERLLSIYESRLEGNLNEFGRKVKVMK